MSFTVTHHVSIQLSSDATASSLSSPWRLARSTALIPCGTTNRIRLRYISLAACAVATFPDRSN